MTTESDDDQPRSLAWGTQAISLAAVAGGPQQVSASARERYVKYHKNKNGGKLQVLGFNFIWILLLFVMLVVVAAVLVVISVYSINIVFFVHFV